MSSPSATPIHDWHLSTNGGETKVSGVAEVVLTDPNGFPAALVHFLGTDGEVIFAAPTGQIIYMKRLGA